MKKNIFTLLASAALLCACQATDNKGRIDLELAEMKSDTLWVGSYVDSEPGKPENRHYPARPDHVHICGRN